MAPKAQKSLHIVMFPWLAFGHIIPFLDLSKLIAQKGHKISFVSTPRNIDRLPKLPPDLASSITLVKIPLPKLAELPENAEATMDIHGAQMDSLKKAYDGLETGLTRFLEDSCPDWVIQDFASHWLSPIAARLRISRAVFWIGNAWFLAFVGPTNAIISGSDDRTKPEDFMVPPKWIKFETKLAYRRYEADWIVGASQNEDSGSSDFYRLGKVIFESEAILLRHCCEFEPDWLTVVEELHHKPVFPLGLMPPKVQEDGYHDEVWAPIRKWLDAQNKGSVVYVALGSEVIPSQHQLTELAHGLELSGVPFFLVQRKPSGFIESDSMKLPDGFEERVRGRGIVWRGWVPQLKILSHESVGGFLTHSGWSSVIEGLVFGQPLITLPFLIDHGLTSRIIVEKQLGIEIPRDEEDGSFTRNSVANSIKLVMLEDDAKKFKERAKEVSEIFGDQELHRRYIDNFVEFIENH
ncbi:UDP-glucuronosyl and UDP-glucosyl transferase [Handroanthus impetiginosus]|uniref:Glycosyltransferase n=1 Tax=Handroanthus impetiginosus TaxID=429701 RepID=A0A2G9GFN9_9LAMI|nr:UDP-glucuronosyl and UDP-glucosyl transferase [Handroanthus impetiginosus]